MSWLLACAVCYGEPGSPMTIGAQAGVLALLGVIAFVLGAIVTVTFTWSQRAKMIEASQRYERGKAGG